MTRKIKKVLLINPFKYGGKQVNIGIDPVVTRHAGQEIKTGFTSPVGLTYIAAVLLNEGFHVRILDPVPQKLGISAIYRAAEASDAIVMPYGLSHAEDIARFLTRFKSKFRVLTCTMAVFQAKEILSKGIADAVVRGEAELVVLNMLKNPDDLASVKGAIYLNKGKAVMTEQMPYISDLDTLPFPSRHLINNKLYTDIFFLGEPTAWVITSRGCPFNCIYCSQHEAYGRKIRYRNPKCVVDELEEVATRHKITNFVFFDECFNANDRHASGISREIIRRGLRIRWSCAARADLVKRETVRLMKQAGCIEMRFGLESANDAILKYLQKDMTVEGFEKGARIAREEGMSFSLHCIFGSPMETERTVNNTLRMVKRLDPLFVAFNILTPLPGSQLYDRYKDRLNADDMKGFDLVHTNFSICKFSNDELHKILKRAYRMHYLNMHFVVKYMRHSIHSPYDMYCFIRTMLRQGIYVYNSIFRT